MKSTLYVVFALGLTVGLPARAAPKALEPVSVVSEKILDLALDPSNCRIVRAHEPRGEIIYQVVRNGHTATVSRPIYSDLCAFQTQQFVARLFSYVSPSGDLANTPVIGFTGGNEDEPDLSFPSFSRYVLRPVR